MSPKILEERGFRAIIYVDDHVPAHVHVKKAGKEARIKLDPVELWDNFGFKPGEIRAILALVIRNQGALLKAWDAMYPER